VWGAGVVSVLEGAGRKEVHVAFLDELRVEQQTADQRLPRSQIGVRLVLRAEREKTGETLRRAEPRDLRQICLDARPYFARRACGQRPVKICARDLVRTHAEIQRA